MNSILQLDLRQRFNLMILVTIISASCLLIVMMHVFISKYTNNYTNHYWREHTKTFSESALYPVIIGSMTQSESIVGSFAKDKNVIKASIYNGKNELLASSGEGSMCLNDMDKVLLPNDKEGKEYWCFYSPIIQEQYLGYVELVISKDEYHSVMNRLAVGSVIIIILFSTCIFLIIHRLSSLFTSTLMETARVLKRVSEGERGERVNFYGSREIDIMRTTLNDMLTSIELTETELEKSVEDRTSALRIALESSETANVYKAQIMSMVSHEMKTPLHAIGGYLQLLEERLPVGREFDTSRSIHCKALLRVNDLNRLIDNILLHARLEADRYEVSYNHVEIAPLMNSCIENASQLLNRNNNHFEISGPDGTLVTDAEMLRHIVNNLLSNACKFTTDGIIYLHWRLSQAFLIIEVADTGPGIPVEFRKNIFDPWWQVDMSLGRKHGGHGLGLAITKQFVQRLGGDIAVDTNGHHGTRFTIRIPCSTN